jgi:hypothetical protein
MTPQKIHTKNFDTDAMLTDGSSGHFFFLNGNHRHQEQEEKSFHDLHQSTGIILGFSLMFAEKEDKPPPHTTDRTWLHKKDRRETPEPKPQPSSPIVSVHDSCERSMTRLILVLLGALDLGDTAELLGAVLPLLACKRKKILINMSRWEI